MSPSDLCETVQVDIGGLSSETFHCGSPGTRHRFDDRANSSRWFWRTHIICLDISVDIGYPIENDVPNTVHDEFHDQYAGSLDY